jgi:enolase
MIVPTHSATYHDALRAGAEVYQFLKKSLSAMSMTVAVGDEGGFAPKLKSHAQALDVLAQSIQAAGYEGQVRLALDCASSEYYREGRYCIEGRQLSAQEAGDLYAGWAAKHGIVSIEDPLAEDDWSGWNALTAKLGDRMRLIGDDLFVTNPSRLERGIREKSANAILIKLNQIGTLTETVAAVRMAQKAGFSAVISHRSGETEDSFIADLAVALNAGAIKTGAPCRSERLAKYNRLIHIESELGARGEYAGDRAFRVPTSAR